MAYDEAMSENEEEQPVEKQQEEIDIDPVVKRHGDTQESHVHHLYISKPVCSHFQNISFLMFPNGIHALVNNHPYHFELLNAIVRKMRRIPCNVGKTKYQIHYVILGEITKYIFNFCQYHVLPLLKKTTKDTWMEAANQLRLMGANLGSSDNWPAVLMQDVMSMKVILDHNITTRVMEIRRSNNRCISKIMEYKRKYEISQARVRLLIEGCELRCREALREKQEILNTSNSRASIIELEKKIVAFKELLKSDVVLNENLTLKCKNDDLMIKLADYAQAYNTLKQKNNILSEKLQKIESQKKRKLTADQYVMSPVVAVNPSARSTIVSVPSMNNPVNFSMFNPSPQPPVYWCDPTFNQNTQNTQAIITPCTIVGSTTPIAGSSGQSQLRALRPKPDESLQMLYTIPSSSTNVSPSVGVPTTNASS